MSAGARRFTRFGLGVGLASALSQLLFAVQLHRPLPIGIAAAVATTLLLVAWRLRPERRLLVALVVLPATLVVYGFEWRISSARPYDGTMAARRGVRYDTRTQWELVEDRRAEGVAAFQSLQPRALLVLDLDDPHERDLRHISPEWGVVVDGERVLPLGGISGTHVIGCNESGVYGEYESDEHGFNNPRGIWDRGPLDVALIGDSFTQEHCVPEAETAAHWIRERHPATLNLGMAGNGPLLELATLEEFVAARRPKTVVWTYYGNDIPDLDVEKGSPLLMRYLEEDGFTQRLAERQPKVDAALIELAGRIQAHAFRWPPWLGGIGLTRQRAPMWLGDLLAAETHSSASAVLRLDRIAGALGAIGTSDLAGAGPDLALLRRVLDRARRRVESWGGKLYFVYMADIFYLRYHGQRVSDTRAGVLGVVRDAGIELIDTWPDFVARDPAEIAFHTESHCSPAGYRLLAEIVLARIGR